MTKKDIYVVYLTEYLGDKLPRFYIGSTNKKNVLNGYNGSVRSKKYREIYKEEQEKNKHLFKTEILYECFDRDVALHLEFKYQKYVNCVERDDYYNMSYAGGKFGKNLTTPESIQKGLETRRRNGSICNTPESIQKGLETKRKNGTLSHKQETIEKYKTSMTLEDGTWNNNNEKRLKTVLTPDENGNTIAKTGGMNMRNTRINRINEEGLNDYEVMSINQSKYMNTVLENGETNAQRVGRLISETRKIKDLAKGCKNPKAKRINIYNNLDELMFECYGDFKEVCEINNLPRSSLSKSYKNNSKKLYTKCTPNNKQFVPFTGWYAKEIK